MNDFFHPSEGSRTAKQPWTKRGEERGTSSSEVGPTRKRRLVLVRSWHRRTRATIYTRRRRLQLSRNFRGTSTPSWIDLQGRALGSDSRDFANFREAPVHPSESRTRVSRGNYAERLRNELIRARNWIPALDERETHFAASPFPLLPLLLHRAFRIPGYVAR
jgi:hypothetical protein